MIVIYTPVHCTSAPLGDWFTQQMETSASIHPNVSSEPEPGESEDSTTDKRLSPATVR